MHNHSMYDYTVNDAVDRADHQVAASHNIFTVVHLPAPTSETESRFLRGFERLFNLVNQFLLHVCV